MLAIDLTLADTEPLEFSERVMVPSPCGGDEGVRVGELGVSGTVEKGSRGYLLSARMSGPATLRCVRCLCDFPFDIAESIEVELHPTHQAPHDDETRIGRDDSEVRYYSEPQLSLVEFAAEQIELALPMKPLCRPDCRGICVVCGANLNEWECTCPKDGAVDPRLAPLLGLRKFKER